MYRKRYFAKNENGTLQTQAYTRIIHINVLAFYIFFDSLFCTTVPIEIRPRGNNYFKLMLFLSMKFFLLINVEIPINS